MDLNEPNQETQSIVNQNLSRLERYFAYYKQQSKANELQCIPQTNQFIQKIEKESQRSKIQLTYKKTDAVIDLLKQQLSILGIHREHEAAISQYKWHLSERFQLNWKYEQTVCQKIREEKKKEKIKTNKSNKKNPIKMKKYVYVLNKQQQQFQKAKRPFSEIDEKWMTSIKEEQSQDQRQTQQIEKNPEDY